jgi:ribosomal protein S18 acetylase RimI-like enzyme
VITFRELGDDPDDLAVLAEFHRTLYVSLFPDPDERESLENMAGYLRLKEKGWYGPNSYHIVLAFDGALLAGAVIADYLAGPAAGVIEYLLVSPGARGRGVGRALLDHLEAVLTADAAAGGLELAGVVAEMNDPRAVSALADNLDPVARALIWHRYGYAGLDFPYRQPALSPGQAPVTGLILICKPLSASWRDRVPASAVTLVVREYLRWAMRIDCPEDSADYRRMAAHLSARDDIARLPLDRYTGHEVARPFDVHAITGPDDRDFAPTLDVYRIAFPPGPTAVGEDEFRHALAEPGYHLWALRAEPSDPEPSGMASFHTLTAAGMLGYVTFAGPLRGSGRFPALVARLEQRLLADRPEIRGWYAELGPGTDCAPFVRAGCRELAVDYRQPALGPGEDVPCRLFFKPPGRIYQPPQLSVPDLLTDVADVLSTVYGVAGPREHPTYRRIAENATADVVPLR